MHETAQKVHARKSSWLPPRSRRRTARDRLLLLGAALAPGPLRAVAAAARGPSRSSSSHWIHPAAALGRRGRFVAALPRPRPRPRPRPCPPPLPLARPPAPRARDAAGSCCSSWWRASTSVRCISDAKYAAGWQGRGNGRCSGDEPMANAIAGVGTRGGLPGVEKQAGSSVMVLGVAIRDTCKTATRKAAPSPKRFVRLPRGMPVAISRSSRCTPGPRPGKVAKLLASQ